MSSRVTVYTLYFAIILFLVSCNKDEPINNFGLFRFDFGSANIYDDKMTILLDNKFRLTPSEQDMPANIKEGDRLLVHYTFDQTNNYVSNISIKQVVPITTASIISVTANELEKQPNDKLQIEGCWLGGGYINVRGKINISDKGIMHSIVLFEQKNEQSDTLYLYLRHNSHNDSDGVWRRFYISYREPLLTPYKALSIDINSDQFFPNNKIIYPI